MVKDKVETVHLDLKLGLDYSSSGIIHKYGAFQCS